LNKYKKNSVYYLLLNSLSLPFELITENSQKNVFKIIFNGFHMKSTLIFLLLFTTIQLMAQSEQVESKVYAWNELKVEQRDDCQRRQILEGSTMDLQYFEVHASTILPGQMPHQAHTHDSLEEMILIKEGKLQVTLGNESKILGPGSVVLIMPGDEHGLYNVGDTPATYYIIQFKSRKPLNTDRGKSGGGSVMIDFDELEFKPHDKGGIRNYYRRPTSMFDSAEMHVTTLRENIQSHEPHTHGAAEIVLMISGNSIMQIGDSFYQGTAGDLFYLESQVPHAIQNTGDEPCMYFAFQWE
jgi:(S)-ureidoglycine aminohydrolase